MYDKCVINVSDRPSLETTLVTKVRGKEITERQVGRRGGRRPALAKGDEREGKVSHTTRDIPSLGVIEGLSCVKGC